MTVIFATLQPRIEKTSKQISTRTLHMLGRTPVPQNVLRPVDRRAQRRHWLVMQIKRMLLRLLLVSARQNTIYQNLKQSDLMENFFKCFFRLVLSNGYKMTDFTDERRTDRAFYVVSVGSIRRKALSNKRKLDSRTLAVIALNNVSDVVSEERIDC